jgi:hypothetical protein
MWPVRKYKEYNQAYWVYIHLLLRGQSGNNQAARNQAHEDVLAGPFVPNET